ncbi:MAG: UDP-N-acetylmuramate dehydrogenase [Bacteroidales bacterium]|nr:UDP-N-acetylmuramate dehydrogenase [Bacteroidales bacterium]
MTDFAIPAVLHDVSLRPYHTFGTNAVADCFIEVDTAAHLDYLIKRHLLKEPFVILGGGSNMVFADRYRGTVVRMATKGIRLVGQTDEYVLVEAEAGEEWDSFVRHCIGQGWYGLENLAAIPGTVGASAVQNVGAYGSEAGQYIDCVHAVGIESGKTLSFSHDECLFAYRDSVFKHSMAGRVVITSVVYRLHTRYIPNLSYSALAQTLRDEGIANPTAMQTFDIVTRIRWGRLPRPEEWGSAGSFFKNPVVTASHFEQLQKDYQGIAGYAFGDGYKLAAGWLIEQCGWRGRSLGRCGVWDKQALVLVNRGGCTFDEIVQLANAIIADVEARFGVTLQREVIFNE